MKKKVNTVGLVKEQAKQLVSQMTIEEKASLMSGANFWNTKAVERLGVKSFMLTDGPHGLRKQAGGSDHLGINESIKSTAFPTAQRQLQVLILNSCMRWEKQWVQSVSKKKLQ